MQPNIRTIVTATLGALLLPGCALPVKQGATPQAPAPSPAPATQIVTPSAAELYEQAKVDFKDGRLDAALNGYRGTLALDPQHIGARNGMASVYTAQGRLAEAATILQQLVADAPRAAYVQNNLGYVNYLQGNYPAAIKAFEAAIALDDGNSSARSNLDMARTAMSGRSHQPMPAVAVQPPVSSPVAEQAAAPKDIATPLAERPERPPESTVALPTQPVPDPVRSVAAAPASVARSPTAMGAPSAMPQVAQGRSPEMGIIERAMNRGPVGSPALDAPPVTIAMPSTAATTATDLGFKPLPVRPSGNGRITLPPPSVADAAGHPGSPLLQVVELAPNIVEMKVKPVPAPLARDAWPVVNAEDLLPAGKRAFRLEVANGNGVAGLATKVRQMLSQRGMPDARVTNIKPYRQARTEIHYKPQFMNQALSIAKRLNFNGSLVEKANLAGGVDVRLVLGKSEAKEIAALASAESREHLALGYGKITR